MDSDVLKPCHGLVHSGDRALRDLPEEKDLLGWRLEVLAPTPEQLHVTGTVGEIGEDLDGFPDGEDDDLQFVAEGFDGGGLASARSSRASVARS